jgi:lipopolysaccharide export system permease protein
MKKWWHIKKLDRFMVTSFLPPFVMATFIALFVLIMQTLWLYIDDILGKGANLFIVVEFLFYLSMSLVPLALPIGVLLASVMLFGNLGEKYELSSMKSAGISLFRIMLPLIFLTAGVAMFSFLCNEYIIPISNLKFKSRLYDLRKSRPTLNLEEAVFNEDFKGYVIHIGKKNDNGRDIEDILIYDHQNTDSKGQTNIIRAKSGEMYASRDNNFFIMKLDDGNMYQEMRKNQGGSGQYPFMRSSFKSWTKIFDLRQFDMNRTDEDLFKSNQSMKNSAQLRADIDSMNIRLTDLGDRTFKQVSELQEQLPEVNYTTEEAQDTLDAQKAQIKELAERKDLAEQLRRDVRRPNSADLSLHQVDNPDSVDATFFYQYFKPDQQRGVMNKAKTGLQLSRQKVSSHASALKNIRKKLIKHIYELNIKYSMALVCLIFLFIGAPMGAIVRKGGFGYPMLISIVFFILFILMTIFCKKLAESEALQPVLAAWVPVLILAPIGGLLTYRAMNDSKFIDLDRIINLFRRRKKKAA